MRKILLNLCTVAALAFIPLQLDAKGMQKRSNPFLIQHGLPHYTKILMQRWDDKQLNLSQTQKNELLKVRKETLSHIKRLKPVIVSLEKEIINATKTGKSPKSLQGKVYKLAKLRAQATMAHLRCIANTKRILTKRQFELLKSH